MASDHYDVIIIGSGPGGGTMAWSLAKTGKRILLIERGDYLRRGREMWDSKAVFVDAKYQAPETWYGSDGSSFHPGLHYNVGGNSKFYGAVMFRLRERDFGEIRHPDGIAPAWPVGYDTFEPYYQAAEELFSVHGLRGEDPTEPPSTKPYSKPPVSHEPRIQELFDNLKRIGHQPFHLPVGVLLDEDRHGDALPHSPCVRCDAFDGYPCPTNGKADSQIMVVDPALRAHDNLTLMTRTYVEKLTTDASGHTVTGVLAVTDAGERITLTSDIVVVACGALSSALLLLRSAKRCGIRADWPTAPIRSGATTCGTTRCSVLMAVSMSEPNDDASSRRRSAFSDYYFGSPMTGTIRWGWCRWCATSRTADAGARAKPCRKWLEWLPEMPFELDRAKHSMDFWLQARRTCRDPDNRVHYQDGRVYLDLKETNMEGHHRLKHKLEQICNQVDIHPHLFDRSLYLGKDVPIGGTAHQAGTLRFGYRPGDVGPGHRLQGARARQPVCDGCELLSLDRRGKPDPDHRRQCAACRRNHRRSPGGLTPAPT